MENIMTNPKDYLDNLRLFAEHNLTALRKESWKDFKGYGISEDMHIDGDVRTIQKFYEAYLLEDQERSLFFLNTVAYSVEIHLWFESMIEDKSSKDDLYNYIVMNVGEMMTGNFSQTKCFIEDIREDDEFMDEDDELREDVKERLDGFLEKVSELEMEYVKRRKDKSISVSVKRR